VASGSGTINDFAKSGTGRKHLRLSGRDPYKASDGGVAEKLKNPKLVSYFKCDIVEVQEPPQKV